jgi:catechol 2,3-dioxygenase
MYLPDPDGNGIEIYRDLPREEWTYTKGELQMATDPLDVEALLAEAMEQPGQWPGLDPATVLGHMHLHVANIPQAEAFYVNVIGFERVTAMPSATFVSAGGYHHHLGFNTWLGVGAPPPPANAVGLRYFVIYLPDEAAMNEVLTRVRQANITMEQTPTGYLVRDPSQNGVMLVVRK